MRKCLHGLPDAFACPAGLMKSPEDFPVASFRRKPESRDFRRRSKWIPAFTGMTSDAAAFPGFVAT